MKQSKKGFTLIELLVVIAIIGILSTLAVVSLGNARTRARNSKRVADIRNVQTALEIYYTDRTAYPAAPSAGACVTNAVVGSIEGCCLENTASGGGWLDADGATTCTAANRLVTVPNDPGTGDYVYALETDGTYGIQFTLETGGAGDVPAGTNCARASGMAAGAC